MTIRTTTMGGTDWSDGDVLNATDLNDTIENVGSIQLGSGSFQETGTSGSYVDVGNFSTHGDIGEGIVVIEVWWRYISGGTTATTIGIHNATGDAVTTDISTSSTYGHTKCTLSKDPRTSTSGMFRYLANSTAFNSSVGVTPNFDLSATETIYIKAKLDNTTNGVDIRWVAYQILG